MARRYIKHVESNIKGGVDLDLGPRTVLVGPMGSGKSSVVQAIQLAADGAVRDGEGRDKIREYGAVARFFPSGEKVLFSCLTLSDDNQVRWGIKKSGKTWKGEPPTSDFAIVFPFEEAKGLLSGSDSALRSWLGSEILGPTDLETVTGVLPEAQAAAVRQVAAESDGDVGWSKLAALSKKKATSLRRQATLKEKTVDQLTDGVAPPLAADAKEALAVKVSSLSQEIARASHKTESGKEALRRRVLRTEARIQQLEAAMVQAPEHVENNALSAEELQFVRKLKEILVAHVTHFGTDTCMVCRTPDIEENLMKQVSIVEEGLAASTPAQPTRAAFAAEIQRLLPQLTADRKAYAEYEVVDVTPLREQLRQAQSALAGNEASRRAWENVRAVNTEIERLRATADSLAAAAKTLAKVGRQRLADGMESFCTDLNGWLPEGIESGVDLDAGRVGFRRADGALHTALSGGEWSTLVMALGCYILHGRQDGAIPVLTPDDRGWDPEGLARAMQAVEDYPGQVLIMSTVMPAFHGTHWNIVDLAEE